MQVFWSTLVERSVQDTAVLALLQVASDAARCGFAMMQTPYGRTDVARNRLCDAFLSQSGGPEDVLVMLDCDHRHPADIVRRLVARTSETVEVVGALAFRRGEPFDPCFFIRADDGRLSVPIDLPPGLLKGVIVGTGAIAIRRSALQKLDAAGRGWPFFRYEYAAAEDLRKGAFESEDVYFGRQCEMVGIPHYCDTTLVTPHLIASELDRESWAAYVDDHRDEMALAEVRTEDVLHDG